MLALRVGYPPIFLAEAPFEVKDPLASFKFLADFNDIGGTILSF